MIAEIAIAILLALVVSNYEVEKTNSGTLFCVGVCAHATSDHANSKSAAPEAPASE